MGKAFLYCEETDTKIRSNDVVSITTYPNTKWVVKNGWYKIGTAQMRGWYFVSIADKSILSIDSVDIKTIIKDDTMVAADTKPEVQETLVQPQAEVNVLYCPETDTKIYINDLVEISGVKYIAKFGWHTVDGEQKQDWYFVSLDDRSILPSADVDITTITKGQVLGTSELRPTLQDIDALPAINDFIVIPGTDIRIYDSDIVKLDNKPGIKWIVHYGWYIFQEAQSFGWHLVSIVDGAVLPLSAIDLTLCSLETVKTQGSELYDGKVVNYTRPFTQADAEIIKRAFITVETIDQRDNLDPQKLINGKLVRVNDVGGVVGYYYWDAENEKWEKADFGGSSSGGIPELIGTAEHPIILSEIENGLYRVIGVYKFTSDSEPIATTIDHLVFTNGNNPVQIKVITEYSIRDLTVTNGQITFNNEYTTKQYVDEKISILEQQISEIISELLHDLPGIIDERIDQKMIPIPESFIRGLFA